MSPHDKKKAGKSVVKGLNKRDKTYLAIVTLALCGYFLPSAVITAEHNSRAAVDRQVEEMTAEIAEQIENERIKFPPYQQNESIREFEVFKKLNSDYRDGIAGDYQYLITPSTNSQKYCLIVKHPDGDVAKKEGYAYSSMDTKTQPVNSSDCRYEKNTMVLGAGYDKDIDGNTNRDITDTPFLYLVTPGIMGVIGVRKWKNSGKETKDILPHLLQKTGLRSVEGDDENSATPAESTREYLWHEVERITLLWVDYETDPVKVLNYPMVATMSFGPTADFHRAMTEAKQAFRVNAPMDILHAAVAELDHSFTVMIAEAERMRWNSFSEDERRHLRSAQALLNIAMDSASSPHERNVAYKRLLKEVEGIITLSPATLLGIEERTTLRIEG